MSDEQRTTGSGAALPPVVADIIQPEAWRYFELANSLVLLIDMQGKVLAVNASGAKLLGRTREEIIGQPWMLTFVPESQRCEVEAVLQQALNSGDAVVNHTNAVQVPGGERVLRWANTVIRDEGGKPQAVLSTGFDMTDCMERSKAAAEQTALLALTHAAAFVLDQSGRAKHVSPELRRWLGAEDGQGGGRLLLSRWTDDGAALLERIWRDGSAEVDWEFASGQGEKRWLIESKWNRS
jgi:PAS domain S-box-containing protein